jgi:hypothetical protein
MNFGTIGGEALALLKTVAPVLATAVGSPLAGLAVRTVTQALSLPEATLPEVVGKAVVAAGPDQLLALKAADEEFAAQMKQLDVELSKAALTDTADARARQVSLRDLTPAFLSYALTAGFFGLLALTAFHPMPPENGPVVQIMLGALGGAWVQAMSFFFGSSVGSKNKDDLLYNSVPVRALAGVTPPAGLEPPGDGHGN